MTRIEVEHPTGIGPQFIIAGIEGVGQGKLSASVARGTDDDVLPLHQQTVGREQFHIQDATHIGRHQLVGPHHVCLVPQRVAHEIALIVGMYIYLLLHLRLTSLFKGTTDIIKTTR